jgi:hypothetical protein
LKTPGVTVSDVTGYLNLQQQSFENPNSCILLGTTNKMQRFAIFFITVNAVHVLGSFSSFELLMMG